jgi:hypothetical protein
MLRFVRRSRGREQLLIDMYEGMLRERERLVMTLAEQVEYLRAQLHMPTTTVSRALTPPALEQLDLSDLPDDITRELTGVMTDEEEELFAMRQANVISEAEYEDALERMKRQSAADIIE